VVDPVLTTFILWPRQFPAGLLKNPPFAAQQRRLVEETFSFANRPLGARQPVFRFVHFSVPHLPFVFNVNGYHPPFDPLKTAPDDHYVNQIRYTDRLFGELLTDLEESGAAETSTIVLLSDHGFRFGGHETDPRHVPFIVKRARQRDRIDVRTEERGELLLRRVLESACSKEGH
jgi:phosphoglycerol transferase MdoB-like AlkP superfamily enzyme